MKNKSYVPISSQASQEWVEGSTHREYDPERVMNPIDHKRDRSAGNPNGKIAMTIKIYAHLQGNLKQIKERFDSKYTVNPENGCWEWHGAKCKSGYGVLALRPITKTYSAHRISFMIHIGNPLNGCVLHRCDNVSCVNPNHFFLGNYQENRMDCVKKHRQSKGESQHLSKLRDQDIIEIRNYAKSGKRYAEIAKIFDITPENASMIVRRLTWKHIL